MFWASSPLGVATSNSAYVNFAFSYADVSKWSAWGQPWGTAPLNRFPSPGGSHPNARRGKRTMRIC